MPTLYIPSIFTTLLTSAIVKSFIKGLVLSRRILISKPQAGGQSLGKYLLNCVTFPPMYGFFSIKITFIPVSAASTAAVIPAMPAPTINISDFISFFIMIYPLKYLFVNYVSILNTRSSILNSFYPVSRIEN